MASVLPAEFDCENPAVERLLRSIVTEVVAQGGHVAEGTRFYERGGDLSAHRNPALADDDTPLIAIPMRVMTPVDQGRWSINDGHLRVEPLEGTPALTAAMLQLHADLYNACGKLQWFQREHPLGALSEDDAAVAAIRGLRPAFTPNPGPEGFLKTRTLAPKAPMTPVLIPVLDVLNHHRDGAQIRKRDNRLQVSQHHPTGTTECFANYGGFPRDALDLALTYGFVDPSVRLATSAPLRLQVDGVGVLSVGLAKTPGDARWHPPMVRRSDVGVHLSHLTFQADHLERTRVPLQLVMAGLGVADPAAAATEMLGHIVDRNLELLDVLASSLDDTGPTAELLRQAIAQQSLIFVDVRSSL